MARIFPGRFTAEIKGPFVVFLIGMRINKLWAFHKWVPTSRAIGPMIASLQKSPDKGLLAVDVWMRWREVMMVQYWKSFEALESFARSADNAHLPAWKRFNQSVGSDGSVGIWHETYLVEDHRYECLYSNMPRTSLASAAGHVAAIGNRETARLRMGGKSEPAVPSPPNPD